MCMCILLWELVMLSITDYYSIPSAWHHSVTVHIRLYCIPRASQLKIPCS